MESSDPQTPLRKEEKQLLLNAVVIQICHQELVTDVEMAKTLPARNILLLFNFTLFIVNLSYQRL